MFPLRTLARSVGAHEALSTSKTWSGSFRRKAPYSAGVMFLTALLEDANFTATAAP